MTSPSHAITPRPEIQDVSRRGDHGACGMGVPRCDLLPAVTRKEIRITYGKRNAQKNADMKTAMKIRSENAENEI